MCEACSMHGRVKKSEHKFGWKACQGRDQLRKCNSTLKTEPISLLLLILLTQDKQERRGCCQSSNEHSSFKSLGNFFDEISD
jgi:hypothetical protein